MKHLSIRKGIIMLFNEILSFYDITCQYTNPDTNPNSICYVCSDTNIPMTDFTKEGDNVNE